MAVSVTRRSFRASKGIDNGDFMDYHMPQSPDMPAPASKLSRPLPVWRGISPVKKEFKRSEIGATGKLAK